MAEAAAYKTYEQIKMDLEHVSPLALPGYLAHCDFYDRSDAFETLNKAVEQFRGKGIAGSMLEPMLVATANSVGMILARKFLPAKTYRELQRCGGNQFGSFIKEAMCFKLEDYGPEERSLYSVDALEKDRLRRNMIRQPGTPSADGNFEPQFDAKNYVGRRDKDWKGGVRSSAFPKSQSEDGKTVRGVGGKELFVNKVDAGNDRSKMAEGDHVIPLETLHGMTGYFAERYVDLDKKVTVTYKDANGKECIKEMTVMQQIANDDSNFQILAGDRNASKGGNKTNKEYIEYCDKIQKAAEIEKQLADPSVSSEKKAELRKQKSAMKLSSAQKKAAKNNPEKYKLSEKEKQELIENQERAEANIRKTLLKEGAKTVAIEQIGKVIVAMTGPIFFELRDSIFNGIDHGFEGYDKFDAFCKRLWRAFKHICRRLKEIFLDALGDLGKMIATFFMNACKMIKDLFGKFFDLALSGISVVVESVKILMGKGTVAQKGEAILKVLVGFVTGILGQRVIDAMLESLGIPDPFSEILATILSTALSTIVMSVFDKLDIFGNKCETLRKRIDEIFDARAAKLKEAIANFDMISTEVIKKQRVALESVRAKIAKGLFANDYAETDAALDGAVELFRIELPYSSPQEFIEFVQANRIVHIS